jgi:hypothetical protein
MVSCVEDTVKNKNTRGDIIKPLFMSDVRGAGHWKPSSRPPKNTQVLYLKNQSWDSCHNEHL